MNYLKNAIMGGTLTMLAACADPVISDLEDDKVIVEHSEYAPAEKIQEEAQRGCDMHGKVAQYVSTRVAANYQMASLYACMDK